MKAILLAAGLGTRLHPLTERIPKCLVPIAGRPLLAWWFDLLEREEVSEVLINLHHLPDLVQEFVDRYRGPLRIHTVLEPELLGSAGTIVQNRRFFEDVDRFYILYADNLTNVRLRSLRDHNREHPAALTVGLFHAENPRACGIAELDGSRAGRIVSFVEKPEHPSSDRASAGMYVARRSLFDHLEPSAPPPYDFGGAVMPDLAGRMNGLVLDGYLRDIGTHRSLRAAEREWREILATS